MQWISPSLFSEIYVLKFAHWKFLFAISAALGLYAMHRLSRIDEGREISERVMMQEFGLEALRTIDQLSSIAGLRLSMVLPFGWLARERGTARQGRAPAVTDRVASARSATRRQRSSADRGPPR